MATRYENIHRFRGVALSRAVPVPSPASSYPSHEAAGESTRGTKRVHKKKKIQVEFPVARGRPHLTLQGTRHLRTHFN